MTTDTGVAEFSRLLPLDAIERNGETRRTIAATREECAVLTGRLQLEALSDFQTELVVDHTPIGEIRVTGRVSAAVVQLCVVTLEPVSGHVDDQFELRFTTRFEPEACDLDIGPDDEEPAEPLTGDALDIGELAVQQLALALDPWPRLADAQLPEDVLSDPSRDGPFAALARLRATDSDRTG